jgi:polyisoprenoid-binding protein YceI
MSTAATLTKTTWAVDPTHSEIHFKVKHMMIATVTGTFAKYDMNIETEGDNFTIADVHVEIDSASVSSGTEARDTHVRSVDFFDSEKFPKIVFDSTAVESVDEHGHFVLKGNLTIKDITKPVTLKVEFGGQGKDPWGNHKAGFTISGKVNRKDWDLNWNAVLEGGGILVSEEVKIAAEIQLIRQG